jgi:hypothetical protein
MLEVSDAFLLNLAEVSATLIGLFIVGIFFYVETGSRQLHRARGVVEPYMRSATRIVLILYAIPLLVSLALVVLDVLWARLLFLVLSIMMLAANVDTVRRIRAVGRSTRSLALVANEAVSTVGVLVVVLIPWVLGGLEPTREHITLALLISFGMGFLSIGVAVLSAFDVGRFETAARDAAERETEATDPG